MWMLMEETKKPTEGRMNAARLLYISQMEHDSFILTRRRDKSLPPSPSALTRVTTFPLVQSRVGALGRDKE